MRAVAILAFFFQSLTFAGTTNLCENEYLMAAKAIGITNPRILYVDTQGNIYNSFKAFEKSTFYRKFLEERKYGHEVLDAQRDSLLAQLEKKNKLSLAVTKPTSTSGKNFITDADRARYTKMLAALKANPDAHDPSTSEADRLQIDMFLIRDKIYKLDDKIAISTAEAIGVSTYVFNHEEGSRRFEDRIRENVTANEVKAMVRYNRSVEKLARAEELLKLDPQSKTFEIAARAAKDEVQAAEAKVDAIKGGIASIVNFTQSAGGDFSTMRLNTIRQSEPAVQFANDCSPKMLTYRYQAFCNAGPTPTDMQSARSIIRGDNEQKILDGERCKSLAAYVANSKSSSPNQPMVIKAAAPAATR